eukprot:4628365-Pleurochrysis_carterae.AAC.3
MPTTYNPGLQAQLLAQSVPENHLWVCTARLRQSFYLHSTERLSAWPLVQPARCSHSDGVPKRSAIEGEGGNERQRQKRARDQRGGRGRGRGRGGCRGEGLGERSMARRKGTCARIKGSQGKAGRRLRRVPLPSRAVFYSRLTATQGPTEGWSTEKERHSVCLAV